MTTSIRQFVTSDRATTRIAVDVTFLRLEPATDIPPAPLGPAEGLVKVEQPTVGFYRYLYDTVGQDYCWWLRRIAPAQEIADLLADPRVGLHVLYHGGEPAGFFELDGRSRHDVNIAYFGLMPQMVGKGLGLPLLQCATALARADSPSGAVRVNTCTADHPRALRTYRRAGFQPVRTVREVWDIPDALGLPIPDRLRA